MTQDQIDLIAKASGFLGAISITTQTGEGQRERARELSKELNKMGLAAIAENEEKI